MVVVNEVGAKAGIEPAGTTPYPQKREWTPPQGLGIPSLRDNVREVKGKNNNGV